jgi:hypothetical protein
MVDQRVSHIKRLFGKSRASTDGGDPTDNFDIYADVLRADLIPFVIREGGKEQNLTINWEELLADGNQSRKITIQKITDPKNPPDDPDNPTDYIPVPVIDSMVVVDNGQEYQFFFKNKVDPENPTATSRDVSLRRVKSVETNLDAIDPAELSKSIPIDDGSGDPNSYVVTSTDARDNPDVNAIDQYLDAEVIKSHVGVNSQRRSEEQTIWQNQVLLDDERFPKSPEFDDNGLPTKRIRVDPLQNIVNVQFKTIYAMDLFVAGHGGVSGSSHMVFGVRDNEFQVIDSGTYFGIGPITSFYIGDLPGNSVNPVVQSIGESVVGYDTTVDGIMTIGSTTWFINPVPNTSTGGSLIEYTGSDQVSVGDSRAVQIDLTGGKGVDFWNKNKISLIDALQQGAPNGDTLTPADFDISVNTSYVLRDKKGKTKATITVTAPVNQILTVTGAPGTITLPGQSHLMGIVIGKGGRMWFYVLQDFDPPSGSGGLAANRGGLPFPDDTQTLFPYQNELKTYFRIFDRDGNEVTVIQWGTTITHSEVVFGSRDQSLQVSVGDVAAYPTDAASVLAPV